MARVILAMSGGVDSSVAAHLLCAEGHEVLGLFMRHGQPLQEACSSAAGGSDSSLLPIIAQSAHKRGCCTAEDAADARRVADRMDIPFYAVDFESEFERIIDYFVDEYTQARTPNPCVMCNNWLKFGKLFDYADSVGAEFVATGHYAQLEGAPRRLCRGLDPSKDQSYVLFGIEREILPRLLFPVGGHSKVQIREIAHDLGLFVADKRDSQDICFVASGEHANFVRQRRGEVDTSGNIITLDGSVVGQHGGIEKFTIGQRKGLGIALGEPQFVLHIEKASHEVTIGPREALARRELILQRTNWLVDPPSQSFRCQVSIRYNSPATEAGVFPLSDGRFRVEFDSARYGVAPGQAAVCYDGRYVLGGGWIE